MRIMHYDILYFRLSERQFFFHVFNSNLILTALTWVI